MPIAENQPAPPVSSLAPKAVPGTSLEPFRLPMDTEIDLQACIDGDARAWAAFVDRYARVIHASVRRVMAGAPAAALDDPIQDVFVRLVRDDYKLLRGFDPARASLPTWLTLIARSTTIDHLRKKRLSTVPLVDHDRPAPAPETSAHRPELPLHLLSGRQRLVLRLLFDEEQTVAEAARTLEVDEQTIRSTKHKALSRLRRHFSDDPPPRG